MNLETVTSFLNSTALKVRARFVLRRYQAAGLLLGGLLLGGATLFSRDVEFFPAVPRYPHRIALTFDDGPHPITTARLLEILRRERVAATFFVVGKQAERFPQLVRLLASQGHELANHTYNHHNLTTLSPEVLKKELGDTRRLLERVVRKPVRFFRPPGGQYDEKTLAVLLPLGYRMALWTVFPKDHENPPPQVVHDRVMKEAADGGVVLLHSGVESTLAALPGILKDLRLRGYQFLTLTELIGAGVEPRPLAQWYIFRPQEKAAAPPANGAAQEPAAPPANGAAQEPAAPPANGAAQEPAAPPYRPHPVPAAAGPGPHDHAGS